MNYTYLKSVNANENPSFFLNGVECWIHDSIDIIDYRTRKTLITRRVEFKHIAEILLQNIINKDYHVYTTQVGC